MKSWTSPTDEMIEKVLSSVKKETDRQYFFSKLENPLWVEPLQERGYFSNPPVLKSLPDGYVQFPHWPELSYLVAIAKEATDQVVDIVLSLPKTDNPRVYDDILAIALRLEGQETARLLPKLLEYTELKSQFLAHRYPELLEHWTGQGNIDEALEIAKKLIPFQADPREQEKRQARRKNPSSGGSTLEPSPRFHEWEYLQILEKGVAPLAELQPYQVASLLIKAVAGMIRMGMHQDYLDKGRDQDYSEIWCRRVDKPDRDYQAVKGTLVNTLTKACEQVYEKDPGSVDALDKTLRKKRWRVFKRLRQHLYASYPNEQTLPWIREFILEHKDYSKWDHHYEFQLMIRKASEHFGTKLLSEDEGKAIFDAILSAPSKDDFQESMGDRYTDEAFEQRQRYFHHVQLRPFATLIQGNVRSYFEELEVEAEADPVTDESYSPYGGVRGGTVSYRSPKPAEELENLTDEELLTYLNEWDDEHRDKDNRLVEINISALAGVFLSLFKDNIAPNGERLDFWMERRDEIARPVYVATMVKAMLEMVKEKDFKNLDQWIEFCTWVLSHPDSERIEGEAEPRDESRDRPDWGSSRRAVVDFIQTCVSKDTEAPINARKSIANVLQQVCTQYDWRLDGDHPVLLNRNDPIAEAINNTRSRGIESLINFGFWVLRNVPEDPIPEVPDILSKRLAKDAEISLTRLERALLGMHFDNLCTLNREWATDQREVIFPQLDEPVWRDAFGSYIRYNPPVKATFEILRGEFEYAIENLAMLVSEEGDGKDLIDRLGQQLFIIYYLWEAYPLTGDDSLLARFYGKTGDDKQRWAKLFDHAGRSLSNSGKHLDKELTDRAIAYFDWRFEVAEPQELQEFTFWLEAECLDPEWRLRSYAKVLDLENGKEVGVSLELRALNRLLPDYPSLVVECFAKITDAMDQSSQLYISADEATPILRAGLNDEDPDVRNNAERARENLLRFARFDFLELDEG